MRTPPPSPSKDRLIVDSNLASITYNTRDSCLWGTAMSLSMSSTQNLNPSSLWTIPLSHFPPVLLLHLAVLWEEEVLSVAGLRIEALASSWPVEKLVQPILILMVILKTLVLFSS